MKVVLNKDYGGFGLSKMALDILVERGITLEKYDNGHESRWFSNRSFGIESDNEDMYRTDERLVAVVEELDMDANDQFASLEIVDMPDRITDWYIEDYDGYERMHEEHWKA